MANDTTASIIPLRKRPLTDAERSRNYRLRKKQKAAIVTETPAIPVVTPRGGHVSYPLILAAFALAAVGVTMNGWFARSLGSSDIAGWLFLAIGVASDLIALAIPANAANLWQARRRATAAVAWLVWLATFVFAVMAGVGFASVNVSDVTQARASRLTPAITMAEAALNDAITARDRECKGGVGKFCREREASVTERQHAVDAALRNVAEASDPQTLAAMKIVGWLTQGAFAPTAEDFALLRLILLALLPQVGGIVLMIGRGK